MTPTYIVHYDYATKMAANEQSIASYLEMVLLVTGFYLSM